MYFVANGARLFDQRFRACETIFALSKERFSVNGEVLPASTTALQIATRTLPSCAAAAWAAWQACDDNCDEPSAHGGDRVWDVPFRPQGWILGVDNCRVRQVAGAAWRNEVLRGESSPSRRSGIHRLRCTVWHDGGSPASRVPHNAQGRPPA